MRHLINTAAKQGRCPRCGRQTLTAHEHGLPVCVDAKALPDRHAEIAALLDGRPTYTHTRVGHLVTRTAERIASGKPVGTMHAEHRCAIPKQLTIDTAIGDK